MPEHLAVADYPGIAITYDEKPYRYYTVNGIKVPSVSTILGLIDKSGPLMFYTERVTSEGLRRLVLRDGYTVPSDLKVPSNARAFLLPPRVTDSTSAGVWLYSWKEAEQAKKHAAKRIVWLRKGSTTLTGARIMVGQLAQLGWDQRSQTNEAAERGVDVHKVWEEWISQQKIPNAQDYPPNRHGYIRALAKFIVEHAPKGLEAEKMVGSAVHGFAGRLDTVVVLEIPAAGRAMVDVKTSAGVYPNTHFPQLAGYEVARRECGLEPTDSQFILRLGADGTYELAKSDAEAADFLAILAAYKSQQRWAKRR